MSQVITFYSYKGGVGRTMALANAAVLLAQWGYKTLVIDWDLEAPGLENFFRKYINIEEIVKKKGLIDILNSDPPDKYFWKDLLITISLPEGKEPLHMLTAGDRSKDYFNKVRNFDIDIFYEKKDGGNFIENLRNEWKEAYDFVLVDSRTGITDIGGICTIQLPDVMVLLFTATEMGFNGILDVAKRAVKAQQSLPFDRFKLISLPIPARFDTLTEFTISQNWLDKFSKQLEVIYNDWLPTPVDRRKFLELTKIPYASYFSFGEKLPVIEQGVNDPAGLGYAYETISALLVNNFNYLDSLLDNRDEFVNKAVKSDAFSRKEKKASKDTVKVFISYSHKDKEYKHRLETHLSPLEKKGLATFWSYDQIIAGSNWKDVISEQLENSQVLLLLITRNYLISNSTKLELDKIAEQAGKKKVWMVPIIVEESGWQEISLISNRLVLPRDGIPINDSEDQEAAFAGIAKEIEKLIIHVKNQNK
jgi:cellulose biosynthesis protein BcsQ